MRAVQTSLFDEQRMTLDHAIELTAQSLNAYLPAYNRVSVSFSGGKDSTCTALVAEYLFSEGIVQRPKNLTITYADTRMELPPLQIAAQQTMQELAARGWQVQIAIAPLDKRFLVYILGRGVPPPSNHMRWCTSKIKIEPIVAVLQSQIAQLPAGENLLQITGVRVGESAARDIRISMSCSKNGAECGQGWFQSLTADRLDTLAPIAHWRVCNIWDFLMFEAPALGFEFAADVAEAYGGDENLEQNARTGCIGCPLASKDLALDAVIAQEKWAYLAPLKRMRLLYEEWRKFENRLQERVGHWTKKRFVYTNRKGPLTLAARLKGLADVLAIQEEINMAAIKLSRPEFYLLDTEEINRIKELIELKTWPQGWDGSEPNGGELLPEYYPDGSYQPALFDL